MKKFKIELGKIYDIDIPLDEIKMGSMSVEKIIKRMKDGRIGGHFLENFIEDHFEDLELMDNERYFDAVGGTDNDVKCYEIKSLTKSGGATLAPSKMVGSGRSYHAHQHKQIINDFKLIYIIGDIRNFPKIKVKFIDGKEAFTKYGKTITISESKEFFNE